MLDPHYRTIKGFIDLVEKDWLMFGHKFSERSGVYNSDVNDQEKSPIFVQFLDSVRQVMIQMPEVFEYSEDLLLFIAFELYTGKYGTFLCDSE
jgi:myotubularin-related protein 1/2